MVNLDAMSSGRGQLGTSVIWRLRRVIGSLFPPTSNFPSSILQLWRWFPPPSVGSKIAFEATPYFLPRRLAPYPRMKEARCELGDPWSTHPCVVRGCDRFRFRTTGSSPPARGVSGTAGSRRSPCKTGSRRRLYLCRLRGALRKGREEEDGETTRPRSQSVVASHPEKRRGELTQAATAGA